MSYLEYECVFKPSPPPLVFRKKPYRYFEFDKEGRVVGELSDTLELIRFEGPPSQLFRAIPSKYDSVKEVQRTRLMEMVRKPETENISIPREGYFLTKPLWEQLGFGHPMAKPKLLAIEWKKE